MDAFIKSMSLRIDGRYKKTATISDEQKIYELSQIWKDAEGWIDADEKQYMYPDWNLRSGDMKCELLAESNLALLLDFIDDVSTKYDETVLKAFLDEKNASDIKK